MFAMKARDVISGWPRPRSTSTVKFRDEDVQTLAYHEKQQQMVNKYFERWRTCDKPAPADQLRLRNLYATGQLGKSLHY
jgi:hypothetical protein